MHKIELTVHEFMAVMGALDEARGGAAPTGDGLYDEWYMQWKALDERLEKLGPMDRADMLFDGKVSINAIAENHFRELIEAVKAQVALHKSLIEAGDEDGDPDDLEIWENRLADLTAIHDSTDWLDQD